jgi:hypothetical protein
MTHAEVRERLADALLAPGAGGIDAALGDPSDDGAALRAHLAGCAACTGELAALRAIGALLTAAAPDSLTASTVARQRTLAAARASRAQPNPPLRPWLVRPYALAALAAAVILVAGLAGLAGGLALTSQRDEARAQLAELRTLTVSSQALLADSTSVRLALAGPGGHGSVAISPSSGQLVAIAIGLPALPGGGRYDCFIERDGVRTWIGWMTSSADLAWWAGEITWVSSPGRPGDRFLVVADAGGEPVLSGQF